VLGRRLLACAVSAVAVAVLAACTPADEGEDREEERAVAVDPPRVGECRVLAPADIAKPSNASPVVGCAEPHTAETFLVGTLETAADEAGWDDPALGAAVHDRCRKRWVRFVGADASLALRTLLDWAWFRPTEEQWDAGARWFRCDVVGGTATSARLPALPRTTAGVLLGRPDDRWLACVDGPAVAGSPRVPCSEPHTWRAVTTVVVGEDDEPYPGDRLVEVVSRDFCRESVLAWLDYPLEYDFGYTWFHRAEWERGNRRSICWARTDR
jgi:hypothetical protein